MESTSLNIQKPNLLPLLNCNLKAELARRNFWQFCIYYDSDFFSRRPFLKQVAESFQKIYTKEYKRISVSMPPRAGKSYITSLFAAWLLGKRPEESVMRNTCTGTLYDKFSYDTREIVKSEKYKEVFPEIKLREDKQALFGWSLVQSKQVAYFGGGVSGTIIGFGASGVGITDDLYKSLEEALSETVNEKTHSWKQSAHDSRLEKECPQIDIGTRWTTKDIIGTGIENGQYDVSIVIPALDENDNSFCEDVKTTAEYLKIRNDILEEIWAGEYMQQPRELEGILFPRAELNWFEMKDFNPEGAESKLGYCDVADQGDDSLCLAGGHVFANKVFITDIIFTKDNIDITAPRVTVMINGMALEHVRVESNNQGGGFIRELKRNGIPEYKILPINNTANKHTRILMQQLPIKRYFYFRKDVEPGSEYYRAMKEFCSYMKDGTSKRDDAPDAITGLCDFVLNYLPHLFT